MDFYSINSALNRVQSGVTQATLSVPGAAQEIEKNRVAAAKAAQNPLAGNTWGNTQKIAIPYDTQYDEEIGKYDERIKLGGDRTADKLKRNELNGLRWQSTDLQGRGIGADKLYNAIQSGKLTWGDVGAALDISILQDPNAFSTAVDSLLANKALQPATPPPNTTSKGPAKPHPENSGMQDPVNKAKDEAKGAASNLFPGIMDYMNSFSAGNPDSALGKFDAQTKHAFGDISSVATRNANELGLSAAGSQANQAASNLQANAANQRSLLQKDIYADVDNYISNAVNNQVGRESDLAKMDTQQSIDIQSQGLDALTQEIQKLTAEKGLQADAQVQQFLAAAEAWQTKFKQNQLGTDERNQVIGAGINLLTRLAAVFM